jgi:hypothetical protein
LTNARSMGDLGGGTGKAVLDIDYEESGARHFDWLHGDEVNVESKCSAVREPAR